MNSLGRRVSRLEGGRSSSLTVRDAIDRPPQETREQWLARVAGTPLLGLVNSRGGETYNQWVSRREKELER
jgi:hypothetical protein